MDTLTRPESTEHVQLYHVVIDRFRLEWHGFDMDPLCRGRSGRALHIFIRDITLPEAPEYMCLHRMLSVLPSPRFHVYFIFPPSQIVGVVTAHVCKYRSCYVLMIPAARLSWFPLLAPAFVRTLSARIISGHSHVLTRSLSHNVPVVVTQRADWTHDTIDRCIFTRTYHPARYYWAATHPH